MEMANSIEGRTPFLDHHLVEFATTLPPAMKIKEGVEKYIVRQAARGVVTEAIVQQQKHPLLAPPMATRTPAEARGAPHAFVQDVLRSDAFTALPFYDRGRVLGLLDRVRDMSPEEQTATDPILMMALSAAILQKRFAPSA
jgi:asparagine synthase (glutamine-hydrolysing)